MASVIRKGGALHFTILHWTKACYADYFANCVKVCDAFGDRLKDVKSKQMDEKAYAVPFTAETADVLTSLHKIIELQSKSVTQTFTHIYL